MNNNNSDKDLKSYVKWRNIRNTSVLYYFKNYEDSFESSFSLDTIPRKRIFSRCKTLYIHYISKSMGKSLTFRGAVYEAQDILRYHRCRDPICDTHLWKVKHELDMARIRIRQLEKDLEAHGIKPPQAK